MFFLRANSPSNFGRDSDYGSVTLRVSNTRAVSLMRSGAAFYLVYMVNRLADIEILHQNAQVLY